MKARAAGPRGRAAKPEKREERAPTLPAWKAFVVQFSRETNPRTRTFAGRVEHMSSGRRARFTSSRELLAVLRTLLGDLGDH